MGVPRSRFSDFFKQEQVKANSPVTIIGCGGIGSRVAQTLAEIGFNLSLWDDDVVGNENVGSQRFGFGEVDSPKVLALKSRLEAGCQVSVSAHQEKFDGQEELSGIVVCGVDSKETRAKIWESIKFNPGIPLYLDGRVGGKRFKLFAVNPCNPQHIEVYETQLDLSKPPMEAPCTARFAPQAGMALDYYIWVSISAHIVGGKVPFQVAGQDLDVRTVFR